MKKLTAIMMVFGLVLFLGVAQASAQHFSFAGAFKLFNNGGSASFSETIRFLGNGNILVAEPLSDTVFNDAGTEYVRLPDLILSETDYVSGVSYDFSPTLYDDGFVLYDDDNTVLFTADLTVGSLEISGGGGMINSSLDLNLTDIQVGTGYAGKSSYIVDSFLTSSGSTIITLNSTANLQTIIESGGTKTSSYSGEATAAAVPEPATMLLLGSGLLGLLGVRRKQN